LRVDFQDGSLVVWDNLGESKAYRLIQYHIHAPSEHTIDGKNYDVEIHMVHRSYSDNTLASVGVFFDSTAGGSDPNPFISALNISRARNSTRYRIPQINLMSLVKELNFNK